MSDPSGLFSSFDPGSVVEAMRLQFGLKDADITRAMGALLPAAFSGLRHTTAAPDALQGFLGLLQGQAAQPQADMFSFGASPAPTSWFFGPAPMQQAVADQVARITGVQQDAVTALMPVAATLAMGQVARPYLQGQARDLFDAFMAGYARGRPKPVPTPATMMAGYADAVQSFWSSFLGVGDSSASSATPEFLRPAALATPPVPRMTPKPARPGGPETTAQPGQTPPEAAAEAETEANTPTASILDDWFAAGRAFQANQLKAIETVFDNLGPNNR